MYCLQELAAGTPHSRRRDDTVPARTIDLLMLPGDDPVLPYKKQMVPASHSTEHMGKIEISKNIFSNVSNNLPIGRDGWVDSRVHPPNG